MKIRKIACLSGISIFALSVLTSPIKMDVPRVGFDLQSAAAEGGGNEGSAGGDAAGGGQEGGGGGDPAGGDRGQGESSGGPTGGGQASGDSSGAQGGAAGGQGGGEGGAEGNSGEAHGGQGAAGQRGKPAAASDSETARATPAPDNEDVPFQLPTDDPNASPAENATLSLPAMGEAETSGDSDRPTAEIEEASPNWLPPTLLHLREAAERGDAQAQFTLAVAYEKGLLVNEDLAWAARWYGQAAYQGHSEAQYIYGNFKLAGIGTKQDLGHAYRWMTIAARQGHQKASEASAQLEVRLGISALYLEREWANAFKPATGVSLFDPPTVEYVQTKLAKLGYAPGPADGFMGPRTTAALEKFKKDYGLAIEERLSKELLRMIHRESWEEDAQVGSPAP